MSAENLAAADEQVTQEVTTLVRRYFELLYTKTLISLPRSSIRETSIRAQ